MYWLRVVQSLLKVTLRRILLFAFFSGFLLRILLQGEFVQNTRAQHDDDTLRFIRQKRPKLQCRSGAICYDSKTFCLKWWILTFDELKWCIFQAVENWKKPNDIWCCPVPFFPENSCTFSFEENRRNLIGKKKSALKKTERSKSVMESRTPDGNPLFLISLL